MWEWWPVVVAVLGAAGMYGLAVFCERRQRAKRAAADDWWRQNTTVCQLCAGTGRVPFNTTTFTDAAGWYSAGHAAPPAGPAGWEG